MIHFGGLSSYSRLQPSVIKPAFQIFWPVLGRVLLSMIASYMLLLILRKAIKNLIWSSWPPSKQSPRRSSGAAKETLHLRGDARN